MRYPRKPGNPKSTAQPKHRHAAPTSWQRRTRYLQLLAIPVAFSLLTVSSPANAAPLTTVDADQTVSSPTWDAITRDSQAVAVATTVTPQQVSSISSDIVAEAGSPHAAAARAAGVTLTPTDIIAYAETFTGTPYVYGGSTPSGFDCSGFTAYIWAHYGVTLPHSASAQAAHARTCRPMGQPRHHDRLTHRRP